MLGKRGTKIKRWGEERRKFFFFEGGKKDGREVALEETRGTIESARRKNERDARGERWREKEHVCTRRRKRKEEESGWSADRPTGLDSDERVGRTHKIN